MERVPLRTSRLISAVLLLAATGCSGLRVVPADPPVGSPQAQPLTRLRAGVDAEGCPRGPVLKRLADSLLEAKIFRSISRGQDPPDLILELYCSAQVENVGKNELKAMLTGAFFFLPAPFIHYHFDHKVLLGVVVKKDGVPLSSYRSKGSARVETKFLSLAESFEAGLRAATAQATANLIDKLERDLPLFERGSPRR